MNDILKAKELLIAGEYTAVLCKDECIFTSKLRGVRPLVIWVEDETDFSKYTAADKVVGKATAFLYLLLGVRTIYAHVISKPALQVLKEYNVVVEYGTLVENIINRQGDGICPFEQQVLALSDKNEAYAAIREKMRQMNIHI